MPFFLGKYYDVEVIFTNEYSAEVAGTVCTTAQDVELVRQTTATLFTTMKRFNTKTMKRLLALSDKALLVTCRIA